MCTLSLPVCVVLPMIAFAKSKKKLKKYKKKTSSLPVCMALPKKTCAK